MPKLQRKITKCPHCGKETFGVIKYIGDGCEVMTELPMTNRRDVIKRTVNFAQFAMYIKRCYECGFVGLFDMNIVDEKGKL